MLSDGVHDDVSGGPRDGAGDGPAPLLLPVGRCVGVYFDGRAETAQQVLLGTRIVELTDAQFAVWSLAHAFPEKGPAPWTRADVTGALSSTPLAEHAATLIDLLLERGLLAEITPHTPAARRFAATHRLRPLLLGLGPAPDDPDVFAAGFPAAPLVGMTRGLYEVWTRSGATADLWTACGDALLARDRRTSVPDAQVGGVLDAVLPALHSLLAPSAACLEPCTATVPVRPAAPAAAPPVQSTPVRTAPVHTVAVAS